MIIVKLNEVLKSRNISKYKFSLACGLSYRTITDYCTNKVQLLNKDYLSLFCKKLECSIYDLIEYRE